MQRAGVAANEQACQANHGYEGRQIGNPWQSGNTRCQPFQIFEQRLLARKRSRGKHHFMTRRARQPIKLGPLAYRPFVPRFASRQMTDYGLAWQQTRCQRGSGGIRSNFDFRMFRCRDAPGGQKQQIAQGLVLPFNCLNRLGITKAPAQEAARPKVAQPLLRTAEQSQDSSPVVSCEIDRAIKLLALQRANEREGFC